MSLAAHVSSLEFKHKRLEAMVASEMLRPMPDFTVIQTLKKQKLLIKEELSRLDSEYPELQDGVA
jgi:hypothetical protein